MSFYRYSEEEKDLDVILSAPRAGLVLPEHPHY